MLYPAINELLKKVDSRYTLSMAVAKRARQLVEGAPKLVDIDSTRPVTIATYEVYEGKITYERQKYGIK
ncbi:MAG: DNA-directed RNA polymerase subunit omega [Thermoanaerobacteraceae bacterium]|nr:DNA-directed RNA polymerase subunit omega [Thermoanaerobacteraceae bacterium]